MAETWQDFAAERNVNANELLCMFYEPDSLSMTSSVEINPLYISRFVKSLTALEKLIRTSIGPYGKLKLVKHKNGGQETVSSSSQTLFRIINIKTTLLRFMVLSLNSRFYRSYDGGLTSLLLTLSLIKHSKSAVYPLPLSGKLIEHFGTLFVDLLNVECNKCIIKMDFTNLEYFKSVVETVLVSKPGCQLSKDDIKHLSILLLKIHFESIPVTSFRSYHSNFKFTTSVGQSPKESQLFEGLLIKLPEMPLKNMINFNQEINIRIVLFQASFAGDDVNFAHIEVENIAKFWNHVLKNLSAIIKKIIKMKVLLFACQMVVHPKLRLQLEDAHIVVLDRLGHETASRLAILSGSSNLASCEYVSIGTLTRVSHEVIGKSEYLLLSNKSHPHWTLSICHFTEFCIDETRIVCQQVMETLLSLVMKNPAICFGGGCTEIYTRQLLENKVKEDLEELKKEYNCTSSEILGMLQIVLKSITDVAITFNQGSIFSLVSETAFNHLWKFVDGKFPSKGDKCVCGQMTASSVPKCKWTYLCENFSELVLRNKPATDEKKVIKEAQESTKQSLIFDELRSKSYAYSQGFKLASLMLRTSLVIGEKQLPYF